MTELAIDLLTVWERGLPATPVERGLLLLSIPLPGRTVEQLALVRVGERDARLLTLRERAFGSRMNGRVTCPVCSSELELSFDTGLVRVDGAAEDAPDSVHVDDYEVTVRCIDSTDLAALSPGEDLETNARTLVRRSIVDARHAGKETDADALPPPVVAGVADCLSAADPQSNVRLSIACPDCSHAWQAGFDIASYLWTEIHAWACRILREVHEIAGAYGWREREILALSPTRRQIYLDQIRS
jgi:hypothetical protein